MDAAAVKIAVKRPVLDWILRIGDRSSSSSRGSLRERLAGAKGETAPLSVDQINELSHDLNVPFGYFFLDEPIDDIPAFVKQRTVKNHGMAEQPSRELVDTVHQMRAIQDWAHDEAIATDEDPVVFERLEPGVSIDGAAGKVRRFLRLEPDCFADGNLCRGDGAFRFLRGRLEEKRVIVMMNGVVGDNTHRPLDPKEFRAFALSDDYAPLIFINRRDDSSAARTFSLLHELVHLMLGGDDVLAPSAAAPDSERVEVFCNEVASEVVMPDKLFEAAWEKERTDDVGFRVVIERVRHIFPVSLTAVALRARRHGFISQSEYEEFDGEIAALQNGGVNGDRTGASGGDYYRTKRSRFDGRLLEELAASVAEGRTEYQAAYRLTGTNRATFANLVEGAEQ